MNKKAIIAIVLVVGIIIGAGTAFTLSRAGDVKTGVHTDPETLVTKSSTEAPETTTQPGETETETTTETTTESTTETVSVPDYTFLQKGAWYYYDEKNREAFAFEFTDEDDVRITYFNTENIDGEDAKYVSGNADYSIQDSVIVIDDIPSNIAKDGFVFGIKDNELYSKENQKLEAKDKVSLQYAYDHFN